MPPLTGDLSNIDSGSSFLSDGSFFFLPLTPDRVPFIVKSREPLIESLDSFDHWGVRQERLGR